MSVSLPSNLLRSILSRVEVTPPGQPSPEAAAQQVGLSQEQVVAGVESTATPVQAEQATDAFAAEALTQAWANRFQPAAGVPLDDSSFRVGLAGAPAAPEIGGWDDVGKDPDVIQQTKENNCGSAVAVMLGNELGTSKTQPESNTQKMDALESRFTNGQGTTPHELSNMLANQGAKVTQTSSTLDKGVLDQALSGEGKAAVMVDSSVVDPTAKGGETGRAHWVTVEGKDDQGRYRVKDPSTGKNVAVDADKLANAVDKSWEQHQGGGMMIVESAKGASEAQAAQEGGEKAVALGNTDGGGSRAMGNFGRESS